VAAEALAAKWFEKSPSSPTSRISTSCASRSISRSSTTRRYGADTPFGLFAGTYREQQKKGARCGLNPLVASYGPALLDRAILDALGKVTGNSFAQMISQQPAGHHRPAVSRPTSSRSRCNVFLPP
jgi:hypothetical protein